MRCLTDSVIVSVSAIATYVPVELGDVDGTVIQNVDGADLSVVGNDLALVSSEYPPENVLDEHPKRVSLFSWHSGEYTLSVNGSSSTVAIGGTNARNAIFKVYNDSGALVYEEAKDLGGVDTYQRFIRDDGVHANYAVVDYPYQLGNHTIKIQLETEVGEELFVGLIRAGVMYHTTRDADMGMAEGLVDYSIERELSNGAFYYKKRDIVRTFSGQVLVRRDPDFYEFMQSIFQNKGKAPLFWEVTDIATARWAVFARAVQMPSGLHSYHDQSTISFQLIEVL